MPGTRLPGLRYRFAGFELEPRERRLQGQGEPLTLAPKAFDVLVMLVERAGHVVGHDEMMATLWPRSFVTDASLAKQVWAVRKVLGDDAGRHGHFIETVPKLGYRFIVPVECDERIESLPVPAPIAGFAAITGAAPNAGQEAGTQSVAAAPERRAGDRRKLARRRSDPQPSVFDAIHMRRTTRWPTMGAALVAILVVGALVGMLGWGPAQSAHARAAPGSAVAVMTFGNLSHRTDEDWLAPALAEMLATELTAFGKVRVVPGQLVRNAGKDLPVPTIGGFAPAGLAKLHERLRADYVLSGSYVVTGSGADAMLRVDLVLQDARRGSTVAQLSRSQPLVRLLPLIASEGAALRTRLGLPAVPPGAAASRVVDAQPVETGVVHPMGRALDTTHDRDPLRARDEMPRIAPHAPLPVGHAPSRCAAPCGPRK